MAKDSSSHITRKLSDKKWILGCLGVVVLLIIAFILLIVFYGMYAANPWGEQPGPGP